MNKDSFSVRYDKFEIVFFRWDQNLLNQCTDSWFYLLNFLGGIRLQEIIFSVSKYLM